MTETNESAAQRAPPPPEVAADIGVDDTEASRFLVSAGVTTRVRRPGDVVRIVVGILLVLLIARRGDRIGLIEQLIIDIVEALPSWLDDVFAILYVLGAIYAVAVIVGSFSSRGRKLNMARDVVIAGASAAVVSTVLVLIFEGEWPIYFPEFQLSDRVTQFPVLRPAVVTAVLATAAPHLVRPLRRLGWGVILLVFISAFAVGVGLPSDALGGVGLGLAVAGTVLTIFGSPGGQPSRAEVMAALAQLGIPVSSLEAAPRQPWGVRRLEAQDDLGRSLSVKVYGRDAQDAQFWSKLWRFLWYRDTGTSLTFTRLQQVEHEALVTMVAKKAGVNTPEVVTAAQVPSGDALLVTVKPGETLGLSDRETISDEMLLAVWRSVAGVHEAHIAHGSLNVDAITRGADGPVITDWEAGSLAAPPERRSLDVVELLVSMSTIAGVERTVGSADQVLGTDRLAETLAYVQAPAVSSETKKSASPLKKSLLELREEVIRVTGAEPPEPAKVRRIKPLDLIMLGLGLVVGYAIISMLADLDLAAVLEELRDATWFWFIPAFIFGQLVLFPESGSMMAAAPVALPLRPVVALQASIKFIGLAIPSAAGRVAMNIAFLRKWGLEASQSITVGALDSVAGFIVEVAILVLALVITDLGLDIDLSGSNETNWGLIFALAVLVIVAAIGVVSAVRSVRERVVPAIRKGFEALRYVFRKPSRAAGLFGSHLAARLTLATVLWLTLLAFGERIPLTADLVIVVAASLLAGLAPWPGGIGVVEAALTAGLVAFGVPEATAFAAAVMYRVFTFYIPPIYGYFAMRWMQQNDYL